MGKTLRRRGMGIGYLVVVAALVWLSIAFYQKKFTPIVEVTLKTDHTGNSLQQASDVKERGIIVGSVKSIKVDSGPSGGCASDTETCVSVTLALDPSKTSIIPSNVSAQILPKTIFGEQYVSLQIPSDPAAPIAKGDTIAQDRSKGALETSKVLGDLLPLLQAVKPAELNATLTAVAGALRGQGKQLGDTLVQLDSYLKQLNPHAQNLVDDLGLLARESDNINSVAPELFQTLDNLQTPAATVVSEQQGLSNLLTTATGTANVLSQFLTQNQNNLISLTNSTDTISKLLAQYSPEYTCVFQGMAQLYDKLQPVFNSGSIKLSAALDLTNLGKYVPGQSPKYITGYGPHCFGLPDNVTPKSAAGYFQIPPEFKCLNDGAPLTADPCGGGLKNGKTTTASSSATESSSLVTSGYENALVSTLLSGTLKETPQQVPDIATMLAAPLYRGTEVTVK